MSDSDYDEENDRDRDRFAVSYKEDLSRIGIGEFATNQSGRGGVDKEERLTPEELFMNYVAGISKKIKEYGSISDEDVRTIIELSNNPDMKYLNPGAFILGYLATKTRLGGKNANSVKYVIANILPIIDEDDSITPPDVVRYYKYMKNKV